MKKFKNKNILITGVCGTVGSEIVKQLLKLECYEPNMIVGIDNNESKLFFQDQQYLNDSRINFFVADIRDRDDMTQKMHNIDVVFHAAALKHVVLCEKSPEEAIKTNVHGVQNIILAAKTNKVEKVIFTSSDKAVNPTNVMGTTKLMGERIMTAANSGNVKNSTMFASTRFGNVLGSSGSVIPIFINQISRGGPVTLTDKSMTRFVMSVQDSVLMLLNSADMARGGEVFVTKMPVIRIYDLAIAMIKELAPKYGYEADNIQIIEVGSKPGEKLYEELLSQEEVRRTVNLENYFSVLPAFIGMYDRIIYKYPKSNDTKAVRPYVSEDERALTLNEIRSLLIDNNLLDSPEEQSFERYWPEDKGKKT